MKRFTPSDLKEAVKTYNSYQVESGSNMLYRSFPRNGMQAVDSVIINEVGKSETMSNLEAGTSRECYETLILSARSNHGKIYRFTEVTKKMAKGVLSFTVNFNTEADRLSNSQLQDIKVWRKIVGYNSKSANYGQNIGFYIHLQNKVTIT